MEKNTIIPNSDKFSKIKEELKKGGADKIHFLADFDRTLTKAFVNGKAVPSLISILRDEKYLTPDYPEKAQALFEKYHAVETDPDLPLEEKAEAMQEWWNLHTGLLIESGLLKSDIEKAMGSENLALREGAEDFLKNLKEKNIPLIILSSAGLGTDSIEIFLSKRNLLFNNIRIISNSFEWDKNGKAIAIKKPIIHGMNKNEAMLKSLPGIWDAINERNNIVLLGDSPQDGRMAEGFDYNNILKIGFLNEDVGKNLELYKSIFDVVLTGDSPMDFILGILSVL